MKYFLSMLAIMDIGSVLCILPSTLRIFWFNCRKIRFEACLTQMCFIHIPLVIESSVLLAMAFVHYFYLLSTEILIHVKQANCHKNKANNHHQSSGISLPFSLSGQKANLMQGQHVFPFILLSPRYHEPGLC